MKIAVLFYGQPRFIECTARLLKEEFNLPDYKFDIFGHFWRDVGYSPTDDKEQTYATNNDLQKYIDILQPKDIKVTNYDILDTFTKQFNQTLKIFNNQPFKKTIGQLTTENFNTKSRYQYGQHLSLKLAYQLMEEQEKRNNEKYDIVVKARTDFIFKPQYCYKSVEEYITEKYNKYILNLNEDMVIRAAGVMPQTFNVDENHWRCGKPYDVFDPKETIYKRDLHNIIRSGDVSIAASRLAADSYYNKWFNHFVNIYLNDIRNGSTNPELQLYRRHDGIQGEIAVKDKIKIIRAKKGRDHRVVMKDNHKVKWVRNKEKSIILNSLENGEEIIHSFFKRYYNCS